MEWAVARKPTPCTRPAKWISRRCTSVLEPPRRAVCHLRRPEGSSDHRLGLDVADGGDGVELHPVFEDAGVNAAEVDGVLQVAALEVGERGVGPEHAGPGGRAEEEHRARRAVVGAARGVLAHAPAELTERQGDHALVVAGLGQLALERGDGLGELVHQPAVSADLAGVGVEAAHGHVVEPRGQLGFDHVGHELELSTQAAAGELGLGLAGDRPADLVGSHLGVARGAAHEGQRVGLLLGGGRRDLGGHQVVVRITGALDALGALPAEQVGVGEVHRLGLPTDGGQVAVGAHGDRAHAQVGRAFGEAGEVSVERLADPAVALVSALGVEQAAVPDVHAGEVRAVGVGVACSDDRGGLTGGEQLVEGLEVWVESEARVTERDGLLVFDAQARAGVVVGGRAEGKTVLSPSLPPESWTITVMRSSTPPGVELVRMVVSATALPASTRKAGTVAAAETMAKPEPRKRRRVRAWSPASTGVSTESGW